MAQKYLKYDELSGAITQEDGLLVSNFPGFLGMTIDESPKTTSIDDMIKLKNSGFTAEEVIQIKKANL